MIAIIIGFTVHEFSHGFAAYLLGDSKAKSDGRLSLNPLRHIDPIGFVCLLVFQFGWAKPVQVDVYNFKDPRHDMAITSFAGPLSNLLLAFIACLVAIPAYHFLGPSPLIGEQISFLEILININVALAIFNMLPLPPLDGSKVFSVALPDSIYFSVIRANGIGMVVLLILIWTNTMWTVLSPVMGVVLNAIYFICDKIYFFL